MQKAASALRYKKRHPLSSYLTTKIVNEKILENVRPQYQLLSKSYVNYSSQLDWYCLKCKQFFKASLSQHFRGTTGGCESCLKLSRQGRVSRSFKSRSYDLDSMKEIIASTGKFELIDSTYKGLNFAHKLRCKHGHEFHQRLDMVLYRNYGCTSCFSESRKNTINASNYKLFCLEKGFTVEGTYQSEASVLAFTCSKGHTHSRKFSYFKENPKCPDCKKTEITWVVNAKRILDAAGIKYDHKLSGRVHATCTCGKKLILSPVNLTSLKICCKIILPPIDILELYGYIRLSETPIKIGKYPYLTTYNYTCDRGHVFDSCHRYLSEGHGCKHCANNSVSEPEVRIGDFLSNLGYPVIRHDYSVLGSQELDILIPSHKIAIEYTGFRWHSEEFSKRADSGTHLKQKMLDCYNQSIRLITIFESEFIEDAEEVLRKIKNILEGKEFEHSDLRWAKYDGEVIESPKAQFFNRKYETASEPNKFYTVYDCGHISK